MAKIFLMKWPVCGISFMFLVAVPENRRKDKGKGGCNIICNTSETICNALKQHNELSGFDLPLHSVKKSSLPIGKNVHTGNIGRISPLYEKLICESENLKLRT